MKHGLIVAVDDQVSNLHRVSEMLKNEYKVLGVSSGANLFILMKQRVPSLILLDIEMPEMDGFGVIEKLKGSNEYAHIPVIFYSSKDECGIRKKCLDAGAVDFLPKPATRESLLACIAKQMPL
jgi:putative two-component system response regulator